MSIRKLRQLREREEATAFCVVISPTMTDEEAAELEIAESLKDDGLLTLVRVKRLKWNKNQKSLQYRLYRLCENL